MRFSSKIPIWIWVFVFFQIYNFDAKTLNCGHHGAHFRTRSATAPVTSLAGFEHHAAHNVVVVIIGRGVSRIVEESREDEERESRASALSLSLSLFYVTRDDTAITM